MKRYSQLKTDLENAFSKLKQAANQAQTELEIDGTIQRFEITFELLWKTCRLYLLDQGIQADSPKGVLKELYTLKMIDKEKAWLSMLEDRNRTTHIYSESVSREIFDSIKHAYILEISTIIGKLD